MVDYPDISRTGVFVRTFALCVVMFVVVVGLKVYFGDTEFLGRTGSFLTLVSLAVSYSNVLRQQKYRSELATAKGVSGSFVSE